MQVIELLILYNSYNLNWYKYNIVNSREYEKIKKCIRNYRDKRTALFMVNNKKVINNYNDEVKNKNFISY